MNFSIRGDNMHD